MIHQGSSEIRAGELSGGMHILLFYMTDFLIRVFMDGNHRWKIFCTFTERQGRFFSQTTEHMSKALLLLNWFNLYRNCWIEFRWLWRFFIQQAPWLRECHCVNKLGTTRKPWMPQEWQNDYYPKYLHLCEVMARNVCKSHAVSFWRSTSQERLFSG